MFGLLTRLFSLAFVVWVAIVASAQVEHLGPIHVDPQESTNVKQSVSSNGKGHASPESIAALDNLVAANGVDLKSEAPWHVEIAYEEFDKIGDTVHRGTIEQFYVDPSKYRRIIKSDEMNQTEIATGSDLLRVGNLGWPTKTMLKVLDKLLSPLYPATIEEGGPEERRAKVAKVELPCLIFHSERIPVADPNGWTKYCYESGTTVLRYTRERFAEETVYNDVFQFQGRYLAHELEVTNWGKPFLKISLLKIEALPQLDSGLFQTAADSHSVITSPLTVPSAIFMAYVLKSDSPRVAPESSGRVTVKFVVDKEGHVTQAHAIDGPEKLRRPAEEAMMRYRFRPFLLLGKAVEVQSTMVSEILNGGTRYYP